MPVDNAKRADRRTLIVIPARYASTRFPGKPLVGLRGATGVIKPLIQRSWEAAQAAGDRYRTVIATDDARIHDAAASFGAEVVMTDPACRNGTERCADAGERLGQTCEIIVNLQGDAPLTPPHLIGKLVDRLAAGDDADMATPVVRCSPTVHRRLIEEQREGRVGGTTAVFDQAGRALYFSKRVIPYVDASRYDDPELPVYLHLGVYAYRRQALVQYKATPETVLETLEGLEQLRFLYNGVGISIVETEPLGWAMWELNNPGDVPIIETILAERGIV